MTVSTNATLDYTRDQLITAAYRLAGVWPSSQDSSDAQSADDVGMAADFMNLELMNLQTEGVVLRADERTSIALVTGQTDYVLPVDTIDIQVGPNDQAGTIVDSSGNESIVMIMSQQDWFDIANKTTAGPARPTRVFIDYSSPITAVFWPPPDSTSITWRYARHRLLKDMDSGSVTVELYRRWLQFVTYAVAAQCAMAKNITLDRVNWLRKRSEDMKEKLLRGESENGKVRFQIGHKGRFW